MNTALRESDARQADLAPLYDRALLWRGRQSRTTTAALGSGFAELDAALHSGGWPASGLVELLCATPCPQALRLMMPALARLQDGLIVLANPPARPQASTLRQAGIHSANLLVMRSPDTDTLLRACRESATSGAVSALVLWLPEGADSASTLRRLHRAAQQGQCLLVLVRAGDQAEQASPAPLRLTLQALPPAQLQVEILKQPGGWGGQKLTLGLMPERIRQPLEATAQMPTPSANPTQRRFQDPDSRFAWRPQQQAIAMAARAAAPTQNLSLPL